MIWVIFTLTLGQLLRQRRTLLLLLLAAIPVGISFLFRLSTSAEDAPRFAAIMMSGFVVNLILPLIALVVGTSALGQEIEDGTAVYLLAKPLARWKIVVAKTAAAAAVVAGLSAFTIVASGLPVLIGREADLIIPGFVAAAALGAVAYSALFVSLSVRFGRALVIGLAYVFVWEALVSQFIPGVRFFSVRAYTLGIVDAIVEVPGVSFGNVPSAAASLALMAVLVALVTWYAVRRLQAYELGERV